MKLDQRIASLEEEYIRQKYVQDGGSTHHSVQKTYKRKGKIDLFVADNADEVLEMVTAFKKAIGIPKRGNSRTGGIKQFYKDLVICFLKIHENGLKLPRWYISKKHSHYLYPILKEHGYIANDITYEIFVSNPRIRNEIHHKVERIFLRAANAIKKPPQK